MQRLDVQRVVLQALLRTVPKGSIDFRRQIAAELRTLSPCGASTEGTRKVGLGELPTRRSR